MALKKQHFAEDEIAIFDEACIYKRGDYWQFRMWLPKENKNERASALKEVKRLCKEFGFTAGMLKGSLAEGRKKQ